MFKYIVDGKNSDAFLCRISRCGIQLQPSKQLLWRFVQYSLVVAPFIILNDSGIISPKLSSHKEIPVQTLVRTWEIERMASVETRRVEMALKNHGNSTFRWLVRSYESWRSPLSRLFRVVGPPYPSATGYHIDLMLMLFCRYPSINR